MNQSAAKGRKVLAINRVQSFVLTGDEKGRRRGVETEVMWH